MARTGVQAQSPTPTCVPSERVKGVRAHRRVLTWNKLALTLFLIVWVLSYLTPLASDELIL